MRQLRQVLRLHLEAGLSYGQIGRALGVPKSTVGKVCLHARAAEVSWALAQTLSDEALEARLYPPAVARCSRQLEPDWAVVHQELKRPGVTLQLLWEEDQREHGGRAYKYTAFCTKYRAWAASLKRSMRQTHLAGDKLFIDYAGQTVPIVDAQTGEIRRAQIFVGALIRCVEFIGGVPRLIVPDQARALIARPDRYEPGVGRLLEEFCDHYDVAVLPARPGRPQDKPKVEVGVQLVERWILARLRHRRFFALAELDRAIGELLAELNQRPFKKLPGCRASAFDELERAVLRPLPASPMVIARFKRARVNIDYHVELDGHYSSVPHRLVRQEVELRVAAATVEAFVGTQRVAVHPYSTRRGTHTTSAEHMPASHRAHREWTPARLLAWGERVGAATAGIVRWQMEHRPHPEQGYRACLGLQRLARQYGPERLEAACARAMSIRSPSYRSVASILAAGLDRQPPPPADVQASLPLHDNVRGPDYYH